MNARGQLISKILKLKDLAKSAWPKDAPMQALPVVIDALNAVDDQLADLDIRLRDLEARNTTAAPQPK